MTAMLADPPKMDVREPVPTTLLPAQLTAWGMEHALARHPVLPVPDMARLREAGRSPQEILAVLRRRHEMITRQFADPLRHGWESPGFIRARKVLAERRAAVPEGVIMLLIQGGNRPGKTEFGLKFTMESLVGKPQRHWWVFQQNQRISRETHQSGMFRYIPPEWRPSEHKQRMKLGRFTNISYTQSTGFSYDSFVLPNGSQCDFKFYEADITSLQGANLDGIWFDELVPHRWIEDAKYRLVTKNGLMVISFTAIDGYTETVASFNDGATVIEEMEAELLPVRGEDGKVCGYEKVPLIMSCLEPHKAVVYFPTQENFYNPWGVMKQTLIGKTRDEILTRAYGVAVKKFGAVFPRFSSANVLAESAAEFVLAHAGDYAWYMLMDPAGVGAARNPFMQWWAVSKLGQKLCMWEWPQPDWWVIDVGADRGVWAEADGSLNGKKGPGQEYYGFKDGLAGIAREILRVEEHVAQSAKAPSTKLQAPENGQAPNQKAGRIRIIERWMDSRVATQATLNSDGATSMVEKFEQLPAEVRLFFSAAPGRQSTESGEDWKLAIAADLEPHSVLGAPVLMFAPWCRNTIFGMTKISVNEKGKIEPTAPCLDPVHLVKYFELSDARYIEPQAAGSATGRWGGPSRG